ncbi:MAG: hypothetical protein Q4E07_03890 [Eubacteriales bacterium]|nr:hypothetical protein [Eubacteriales bacterium]
MPKNNKPKFEDDGRTIVSMDFDKYLSDGKISSKEKLDKQVFGSEMSNEELKVAKRSARLAGLTVALVFGTFMVLVLLFITKVWL